MDPVKKGQKIAAERPKNTFTVLKIKDTEKRTTELKSKRMKERARE